MSYDMNSGFFIDYLINLKVHYKALSNYMKSIGKEDYALQHEGRVKLLDYLIFIIREDLWE